MNQDLFIKALEKGRMSLAEKLLHYQQLTTIEKVKLLKRFINTKGKFVVELIKIIEDAEDEDIQECFCKAVLSRFKPAILLLLAKGASVNKADRFGELPLNRAISQKKISTNIIELLIDKGADINKKNKWNESPITLAARRGNLEVLKFLISKGATVDTDVLVAASSENQFQIVDYLLKLGVPIPMKAYFMPALRNHDEMVLYLLEHDPTFSLNSKEYQPLAWVVGQGKIGLTRRLINQGLNHNTQERKSVLSLALISAVEQAQGHLIPFLINHGADINYVDEYYETPLDVARNTGNKSIIELVKRHGGRSNNIRRISY